MHDDDGRVEIDVALKAISKILKRRKFGEVQTPEQLIDYLEKGANRIRYNIGRPLELGPKGEITHIRAIQGHSSKPGKVVYDELMTRCSFTSEDVGVVFHVTKASFQASITKYGLIAGGLRGRGHRTHVYVSVVMPGTPVKSHRPDPRAIDLNQFIKEVYEIKWGKAKSS